ncbi:MAG: polysaccharide deacetylase family protein [Gammaproteobacteria bacterium]|nr:polysaccharide deacetylase family protein [Gammaproteobacteria bacterium]
MSVVLMYHALYSGDDTAGISAEDLPYAVSEENFIAQLDKLAEKRVGLVEQDNSHLPDIVITFDDGHVSNFELALPHLQSRSLQAYFFITTDYTNNRPFFMSSDQLRQLSSAGMEIGGHGCSHAFFDDLDAMGAKRELDHSIAFLQKVIGKPVRSMSFPGGRYNTKAVELARTAGYRQLFGSGFGTINEQSAHGEQPLNRVAIRRTTSDQEFKRIIEGDTAHYRREQLKQTAKGVLKRSLGNRLYHGLYKSFSSR